MKILATGANGQVGQNLIKRSVNFDFDVFGFTHDQLDITSAESIKSVFKQIQPDLVINAAAYTAVDKAESEFEKAFSVNETGPRLIAEACAQAGIPLLHISTDYVFDGLLDRPYVETDPVAPQGVYARSKEAGERRVREALAEHIVLRTSWVFSKEGACFPKTILRVAKQRSELKVVDDQIGGPTSARSIAETLLKLCEKFCSDGGLSWGTYHFSQLPYVSWFEFATHIVDSAKSEKIVDATCTVKPCTSDEFPTPVKRPANSRLDSTKIQNFIGQPASSWERDIEEIIS